MWDGDEKKGKGSNIIIIIVTSNDFLPTNPNKRVRVNGFFPSLCFSLFVCMRECMCVFGGLIKKITLSSPI